MDRRGYVIVGLEVLKGYVPVREGVDTLLVRAFSMDGIMDLPFRGGVVCEPVDVHAEEAG